MHGIIQDATYSISEMPFARFTVHHNFEVERQFAGRDIMTLL
jgi:hypothetical protein